MKKNFVLTILALIVVFSLFGAVSADDKNIFSDNGDLYQWSLDGSSGLLTVNGICRTGTWNSSNSNTYYSEDQNIKAMVLNNIHDSYKPSKGYAFNWFSSSMKDLKTITVNSNCSRLDNLYRCVSLEKITFNNNKVKNTYLGFTHFSSSVLPEITYDKNNTSDYLIDLSYYSGNKELTVPARYGNDPHIAYTFRYSTNINSITFESGTKTIPAYAFADCGILLAVSIPSGVTEIGDGAFYGSRLLNGITIPATVKSISYNAFFNTDIKEINFGGTGDQWYQLVKHSSAEEGSNILYVNDTIVHCSDVDISIKRTDAGDHYEYKQFIVGWVKKDGKWYYYDETGTMVRNKTVSLYDGRYHLDENGVMYTGWLEENGKKYFFDSRSGKMKRDEWFKYNDNWYYANFDGSMRTGEFFDYKTEPHKEYYFDESGVMVTGWMQRDGYWFYFNESGVKCYGWKMINDKWYYFLGRKEVGNTDYTGHMAVGLMWINDKMYIFSDKGVMQTGWTKYRDQWHYCNSSGVVQTEKWLNDGGNWYYLDKSGIAEKGKVKINDKVYIFNDHCVMQTGWVHLGSFWYYCNSSGVMQAEKWIQNGGHWYYLSYNGAMHTGWLKYDDHWYYLKDTGEMAVSEKLTINGVEYIFDSKGICQTPR